MILEDSEVISRIESPLNLLNRLRKNLGDGRSPVLPPSADDLIDDIEDKLKIGSIKSKAASIMSDALDSLKDRISEVQKPEKLAAIASEMNKVIGTKSGNEDNSKTAQVIVYAPQHRSETHYSVVHVNE